MDLQIVPVTPERAAALLALSVFKAQQHFIEPVRACLDETAALPLWRPVGIYDGTQPVGFAMYGYFSDEGRGGRAWLDRLLIDSRFQGRGYGTAALRLLLRRLREEYGCKEIYLSLYADNRRAYDLYYRHGFRLNGERDTGGELVMVRRESGV